MVYQISKAYLESQNAEFGTIPNFGEGGGYRHYAVLPYGNAYVLKDGMYRLVQGTKYVYDMTELLEHLYDRCYSKPDPEETYYKGHATYLERDSDNGEDY